MLVYEEEEKALLKEAKDILFSKFPLTQIHKDNVKQPSRNEKTNKLAYFYLLIST